MNTHRSPRGLLVALAVLCACTGSPDGSSAGDDDVLSSDAGTVDAADSDASADAADSDAADVAWTPTCPGGIGCPCAEVTDCESPICLETTTGKQCSHYCGDSTCPPGWRCEGASGGGDAVYYCVPEGGLVCRPCVTDDECRASGHATARCVRYGDNGGFCGVGCGTDADCPGQTVCRSVVGFAGGSPSNQCVAPGADSESLGVCPCSPYAASVGLGTTCWMTTGSGLSARRCKGSRACSADGLSSCQPLTGDDAECLDLQCLDPALKLPLADGTACDDGRACSKGDVCKAGVCTAGAQQCPCEPGFLDCPQVDPAGAANLCLGPPTCEAQPAGAALPFHCKPAPAGAKVCDDSLDSVCIKNACAPLSGSCTLTAVEETESICDLPAGADGKPGCRNQVLAQGAPPAAPTPCDDGLACTAGESCKGGACVAESVAACACLKDADCIDDGDKCNGTLYCDKSGAPGTNGGPATWSCKVNPGTVVACDTSTDGACALTACQPSSGACIKSQLPPGSPCEDGVKCTEGDACTKDGTCQSGAWVCCKTDADCAGKEDGDACNGTLFCNLQTGACQDNPATVVVCPTAQDTVCAKSTCDKKDGSCSLQPVAEGKACEDGEPCTAGDHCKLGVCVAGTDVCPCQSDADCAAKEDGDLCNGTLYCNPVTGQCKNNPATVVSCPTVDDTDCLRAECLPKTGKCAMVPLPAGATCDADGTGCTSGDACDGKGACVAGTSVCACTSDADCAKSEDGDLCNGTLFCDKTGATPACKVNPSTVVSCKSVDDSACVKNLCQPKTGQCAPTPLPVGAPCEDGDPCTAGDGCSGKGDCLAGAEQPCGCATDADCVLFDDDTICNGGYHCKGGSCLYDAQVLLCDDGNPCNKDACDAKLGCVHVPLPGCTTCTQPSDCDDGDACTLQACASGVCSTATTTVNCDDGSPCTKDSCDAKLGCVHAPVPGCATCAQASDCDDGNACTVDVCAAGLCNSAPAPLNCDDGDVCSENDACEDGVCKAGKAKTCDDGKPCTADACDPSKGCVAPPAKDGTSCGTKMECKAGSCAKICPPPSFGADCKTCPVGYQSVDIDVAGEKQVACVVTGPSWGLTPQDSTDNLKTVTLGGNTVVQDSITGLMWHPKMKTKLKKADGILYCDNLVYGGFADWRLPRLHEVTSLWRHGANGSYIPAAFEPDPSQYAIGVMIAEYYNNGDFLSSWTLVLHTAAAPPWSYGYFNPDSDAMGIYCVRAGPSSILPQRFTIGADTTTVADAWTQREWQRGISGTVNTEKEAADYCAALKLDGKSDFRIPTPLELESILDPTLGGEMTPYSPGPQKIVSFPLNTTLFTGDNAATFWTKTPAPAASDFVLGLGGSGNGRPQWDEAKLPGGSRSVRCVRTMMGQP